MRAFCIGNDAGAPARANATSGFVRTHGVGVCRGAYSGALAAAWAAWDAAHGSENDPVACFGCEQLFVVFVVAHGGTDLERFEVQRFEEARAILLQARTALACRACIMPARAGCL